MSPILGIYASQISGHLWAPSGAYDSIATYTVSGSSTNSFTFSSIPQTYTHLQIRAISQTARATYGIDDVFVRFNGDTGSNYSSHNMYGNGSSALAQALTSRTWTLDSNGGTATSTGGNFSASIIDILDYTNTSKYKTGRALYGNDYNGTIAGLGGEIVFVSGLWMNTSAITSITFFADGSRNFTAGTTYALYGVKGQ